MFSKCRIPEWHLYSQEEGEGSLLLHVSSSSTLSAPGCFDYRAAQPHELPLTCTAQELHPPSGQPLCRRSRDTAASDGDWESGPVCLKPDTWGTAHDWNHAEFFILALYKTCLPTLFYSSSYLFIWGWGVLESTHVWAECAVWAYFWINSSLRFLNSSRRFVKCWKRPVDCICL